VKLYDEGNQLLPIVLKLPNPYYSPKHARSMERVHQKHVELLGPEFVEDMTLISITNPKLLQVIKKQYEPLKLPIFEFPPKVKCFCQDLRGKNGYDCLFSYIVHNYETMSPRLKEDILEVLNRLEQATNGGYHFDIPGNFS